MSKLKVRPLKLNNLPYGKYTWIVTITQEDEIQRMREANGMVIAPLRQTLENAGSGSWRFDYIENWRKNKVYTKVLCTHSMDVALLKLCNSDLIQKIYKIEVTNSKQSKKD